MKKYTQEEFDAMEIDENGYKICPSGDYTLIKSFRERCSFSERCRFSYDCSFSERCSFSENCSFDENCSFGKWCSFGECCRFDYGCSHEGLTNSTYFACDRIGSESRKTYFFKSDEGYHVRAGCFFGTFDEFAKRVKKVHCGTKYEKEYLAAIELAKIVLG